MKKNLFSWTRVGKGHVLGFGSGSADNNILVIVFDINDIFQNHKITKGATSKDATYNVIQIKYLEK